MPFIAPMRICLNLDMFFNLEKKKNLCLHMPKGFQIPENILNMHSLSQFIRLTNVCICHSQRRIKLVQRFNVSLPHSLSQMPWARH